MCCFRRRSSRLGLETSKSSGNPGSTPRDRASSPGCSTKIPRPAGCRSPPTDGATLQGHNDVLRRMAIRPQFMKGRRVLPVTCSRTRPMGSRFKRPRRTRPNKTLQSRMSVAACTRQAFALLRHRKRPGREAALGTGAHIFFRIRLSGCWGLCWGLDGPAGRFGAACRCPDLTKSMT